MKKQTILFKTACVVLTVGMGSAAFAGPYSGGAGTFDDPYQIATAQYASYLNAAMINGLIQVLDGVVYAVSDTDLAEVSRIRT